MLLLKLGRCARKQLYHADSKHFEESIAANHQINFSLEQKRALPFDVADKPG